MKTSIVNHYLLYMYSKSITWINNNFKSSFRRIMMKCCQEWDSPLLVLPYLTWSVRPKLGVQIGSVVSGDRQASSESTLCHPEAAKRHLQGAYLPFGHNRRSDDWLEAVSIWLAWNYWCSKAVCSDLMGSWPLTLYLAKMHIQVVHFMISGWFKNLGKEKENYHRYGELSQRGIAAMNLLNICSPFEGSGPHQRDTNDHLTGMWGGWKSRGYSEASWHHCCPYTRSPEGYNEGLWHWWVLGPACLFA